VRDIRGNVDTRLEKLSRGDFDAVILACAGLIRLGMEDRIGIRLGMDQMLPAPGQGALAVEIRRGDDRIAAIVDTIDHPQTGLAVGAERAFLSHLGGGCNTPMGAFAKIEEERLVLEGLIATASGSAVVRDRLSGPVDAAANTARSLAEQLIDRGGESILNSWG
jgi:hydroxymethylbilane synthase